VKPSGNTPDPDNFLKALAKISKKYGVEIGGCGCQGSPYVSDKKGRVLVEGLMFCKLHDRYGPSAEHYHCDD
jgi:hypothetical protein